MGKKVPSLYNKTGILKWLCKWHIHLLKTFIPQSSGRVMMWRHLAAADVTCIVASYFIEFIKAYCPFYICITWDLGHKWKRDGLHNLYWGFKNESWDIHCFVSSGCNSEREHFVILPGGQDIFSIFICNCKHLLPPSLSPSPSLAGWKKKSLSQVICDLLPCSVNQLKIHSLQPFTQSGPIVQEDAASRWRCWQWHWL